MFPFTRLFRPLSLVTLVSIIPACASTHAGQPLAMKALPIQVSCTYGTDIDLKSTSGIVCNIENVSSQWQDLKVKSVRFPDQPDVKILSAEDMRSLAEAVELKKLRSENNTALALSGLILSGALIAAGAHDHAASQAGEAVMVGGMTAAAGREIKKGYEGAQYGPAVYSREHILGGALRVPPELAIRRQLVISHPTQKPRNIEICWDVSTAECSTLSL